MKRKKKKQVGAPQRNQNARKHGFYSRVLTKSQQLQMEQAREVEGIDEEIAVVRVKLQSLMRDCPDRIDLQLAALSMIARLVRTRFLISGGKKNSFKEAITKVMDELAIPLGVKGIIR
jgi:hypothetical protein